MFKVGDREVKLPPKEYELPCAVPQHTKQYWLQRYGWRNSGAMLDLIMLTLVVVCFALALAYAGMCDNLLSPPADKEESL